MTTVADIEAAALPYVGLPFVAKGRTIEEGLDCWGLIRCLYRDVLGAELPDYLGLYETVKPRDTTVVVGIALPSWAQLGEPEPMSVALFNLTGYPCHVGIALDKQRFVHSCPGVGVVLERFDSLLWRRRLRGHFKYIGSPTQATSEAA